MGYTVQYGELTDLIVDSDAAEKVYDFVLAVRSVGCTNF